MEPRAALRRNATAPRALPTLLWAFLALVTSGSTRDLAGSETPPSDPPPGFVLPLKMRHGHFQSHEARALLVNGTIPLHGAVKDLGYFYAEIMLGTPPQPFAVIVDTGSTMTAVPCSYCGIGQCGPNKLHPRYNPDASSTFESIACSDKSRCKCGSPACTCRSNKCSYSKYYAESSTSAGHLVNDVFNIGEQKVRVSFGCETRETGEIYKQSADGIMGLGSADVSIPFQMAKSGQMLAKFSLCFGDMSGDGALMFGDVPLPHGISLHHVPLMPNKNHPHYYNIKLNGMALGDQSVKIPKGEWDKGYGTVLDSGTTFTYFTRSAFNALSATIKSHVVGTGLKTTNGPDPHYRDICWAGGPLNPMELRRYFPVMSFVLEDGFELKMEPINYLFIHTLLPGAYCLGIFDNGNSGTLLGGITFRNVLVEYDRKNGRVGFAHAPCRAIGQGGCWPPPETPPSALIGKSADYFCQEPGATPMPDFSSANYSGSARGGGGSKETVLAGGGATVGGGGSKGVSKALVVGLLVAAAAMGAGCWCLGRSSNRQHRYGALEEPGGSLGGGTGEGELELNGMRIREEDEGRSRSRRLSMQDVSLVTPSGRLSGTANQFSEGGVAAAGSSSSLGSASGAASGAC